MSSWQLLAEAGQLRMKAEIKATGSGLVFSATEESDQSHTFLSGCGRPFIHLFAWPFNKYQQMWRGHLSLEVTGSRLRVQASVHTSTHLVNH